MEIDEKKNIIYDDGRVWSKFSNRFIGSLNKETGYWQCRYQGKKQYIHRLVWMKFRGEIPDGLEIDHINNIRCDNRLINLQLLTPSKNCAKRLKYLNNKSGYIGVSFHKQRGKWAAQFTSKYFNGGKKKHLGYFKTAIEAARFRDNFIIKNGFSHRLNFS